MFRLGYGWRLVACGLLHKLNERQLAQAFDQAIDPRTGERYGKGGEAERAR